MSTHSEGSRDSSPERDEFQDTKTGDTKPGDTKLKDEVPLVNVVAPDGSTQQQQLPPPSPTGSTSSKTSETNKNNEPKKRSPRTTSKAHPCREYTCVVSSLKKTALRASRTCSPQCQPGGSRRGHLRVLGQRTCSNSSRSLRRSTLDLKQAALLLCMTMPTSANAHCTQQKGGSIEHHYNWQWSRKNSKASGKFISHQPNSSSTSTCNDKSRPKLPEIKLINFSGSYADWPSYKEMFKTMILDSDRLSNVEKLHYLRGSLSKEPLQVIQGLPLSGDSLTAAWEMLSKRYQNKRYIIQSYLDMLSNTAPAQAKNAASLNLLTSSFAKARQALLTLTDKEKLADLMFVSQLVRLLDRPSKEAWETHTIGLEGDCSLINCMNF
ncbi:unnamed protein product [Trichogramma brassicae]|uniref:Uncharacterized protein n=1 Tax=Trichogramma brassicae TaxID=86971 RepID=A0A6H5HXY8_9HYME|nr:unnamed protein product [Trichogramma brassicae]